MGKPTGRKKKHSSHGNGTAGCSSKHGVTPKVVCDEDDTIFIDMSRDMKEEGNKLFQKKDYEGAILIYEKAVKLLPKSHVDVAYLRSNLAACYMHMVPPEHRLAINECNMALEVSPKHSKALLKRARCFEALNRFEAACRDIDSVLALEPNNLTALEILERITKEMDKRGATLEEKEMGKRGTALEDKEMVLPSNEACIVREKGVKEKSKKKKGQQRKAEDKVVVEVKKLGHSNDGGAFNKEETMRVVKFVFGEDIRCAQVPAHCTVTQLREAIRNRFPKLKAVLIKYKDREGDLVTITTSEELRWAEDAADPQGSVRLYIVEVNPEQEPVIEEKRKGSWAPVRNLYSFSNNGSMRHYEVNLSTPCIESWIIQFARLFKNHVGFNSDEYLDLHELGMKLYSEGIEDAVTSEEAQEIFESAEEKFQEMTSLALFNWGNVHMSRARKRLYLSEDASKKSILAQVKSAFEWAQGEYIKAGEKYEEALRIKPNFYEGLLALGQQQFEQAKLSWYYAIGSELDLETWLSREVLELFNNAEDNMEKGTEMWERMEGQRLKDLSRPNKEKDLLEKMGLSAFFRYVSNDEAAEQTSNMRSQINILWGTMLYERSVVEFKLGFPAWEESLMAAVEKFKLTGASSTDLGVMIKNHIANETTSEGFGFKIDEIVQAWNEMYDAKRWIRGVPSFRLEPLLRRRVPKLHNTLENI